MEILKQIVGRFDDSVVVQQVFIKNNSVLVEKIILLLLDTFKKGKKLLLFGNGGSATDAQHLAGEFVNKIRFPREALPAISLTSDVAVMTSIANDIDYKSIFSRQVGAIGKEGDVMFAYSTSGNSPNVLDAVEVGRKMGLITVGFSGDKGKLKDIVDYAVSVPSMETPRIQEVHYIMGHIICEIVESLMFKQ
jgi:D-sedoheptulose 7-phosphate isomerase